MFCKSIFYTEEKKGGACIYEFLDIKKINEYTFNRI